MWFCLEASETVEVLGREGEESECLFQNEVVLRKREA